MVLKPPKEKILTDVHFFLTLPSLSKRHPPFFDPLKFNNVFPSRRLIEPYPFGSNEQTIVPPDGADATCVLIKKKFCCKKILL